MKPTPIPANRLKAADPDGFFDRCAAPNNLIHFLDNVGDGISPDVSLIPVTLVYELNGEPLLPVYGGPVRLVVPEKFGFKNVKLPREIEITEVEEYEEDFGDISIEQSFELLGVEPVEVIEDVITPEDLIPVPDPFATPMQDEFTLDGLLAATDIEAPEIGPANMAHRATVPPMAQPACEPTARPSVVMARWT